MTTRKPKNTAIAIASEKAGAVMTRFEAVERAAQAAHEASVGTRIARALLNKDGLHAIISDDKGATLEICQGQVVISVTQKDLENETE